MDFLSIKTQKYQKNNHAIVLKPHLDLRDSKDIIIKGGGVFAIYDETKRIWVTDENKMMNALDRAWRKLFAAKVKEIEEGNKYLSPTEKKFIVSDVEFENFTSNCGYFKDFKNFAFVVQNYNNEIDLNSRVIFKNMEVEKEDYSTGKLPYNLEEGSTESWDQLVGYLYEPEEQEKIEWMIGSIVSGFSKKIQKFFVFYGKPGSGKGTIMKIMENMFRPYYAPFESKRVVSNSSFPLECLAMNPLVAIDEDGDLSQVQDNTRLNSIVSHETIPVETKYKNPYPVTFKTLLVLSSNEPVQITNQNSGFTRRLIDINPVGGTPIPQDEYDILFSRIIKYERGAIAYKCLKVFENLGRTYFNRYKPNEMSSRTDPFFQFVEENYDTFKRQNYTYLDQVWRMYKIYVEDNGERKFLKKTQVREQLKNYFEEYYYECKIGEDNRNHYNVYKEFITKPFDDLRKKANKVKKPRKNVVINKDYIEEGNVEVEEDNNWLKFDKSYGEAESRLDRFLQDYKAQYANKDGIPSKRWDNVTTSLKDIDTDKLHYVQAPEELIVIDFDKKNEKGEKDYELNLKEANKFPPTYAELSKSGAGIHLHYLYSGDISELSRIFSDDIEIKIFTGNASLRRQLTKFNDEEIASISEGLPLKNKKGGKMLDQETLQTEQMMRRTIIKCLRNEIHGHHKPNMDFIYKITTDAYNNGVHFDLTDMYNDILAYAMGSSNQVEYCLDLLTKIHLKSDEPSDASVEQESDVNEGKIVFFDVEVWKNLFIFGFKYLGGEKHILLNPQPSDIEFLLSDPRYKLIGFNCRKYDNHIVYGFMNGYTNEQLFKLSQKIVKSKKGDRTDNGLFGEAYNLSYTDIYDFSKKKQSLKKWEIELGIYHKEMDASWDEPLPEEKWEEARIYNGYDLDATEALWLSKGIQVDFTSRMILADIAGGCPNDTDNSLTEKLILGDNIRERKVAKNSFYYRDLAKPVYHLDPDQKEFLDEIFPEMMSITHGEAKSLLPYFPGYTFDKYKKLSIYKDEEIGEGGLVRAIPGVYGYAKTFDVTSMHPHSLASEYYFGKYTAGYYNLVRARIAIKHDDMEFLGKLFEGKLLKYCTDDDTKSKLSTALKTPINAVYGLTAAGFDNNLRHPDNVDNIVAKRGALFMMDLRDAVLAQGYQIFHIKTDSLKVINPDEYIEKFILDFGKSYGYSFEVEHEFEKICLVNDAVYIAKVTENDGDWKKACKKAAAKGEPMPTRWTATGAQFQIPYVFKTLFSKEDITFDDVCVIKNVSKGALYLDYNENLPDVSMWEELMDLRSEFEERGLVEWDVAKEHDWTKRQMNLYNEYLDWTDEAINAEIAKGHHRSFIGKVGNFCPIRGGYEGAELVCLNEQGSYVSPSGTKDVRWLEADYVKSHHMEDKIDYEYFEQMARDAINDIYKFGGDESFFT